MPEAVFKFFFVFIVVITIITIVFLFLLLIKVILMFNGEITVLGITFMNALQ